MNLKELKEIIDHDTELITRYEETPEQLEVLITLNQPSVGPRASTTIKNINIGFDWERNQYRITPSVPLVTKEYATRKLNYANKVIEKLSNSKKFCYCDNCMTRVKLKDKYCCNCGKKFKEVE